MSAFVTDGGVVHYEAFGRGKPILFIHGWLGSWRYWMSTMETLSDKYRTYAVDLWGFGDTDKSKQRYSINDYVALVNQFVDQMGISQAPIIGHSLGAVVALEYAARHPDRAKKVVAVSLPMNAEAITRRLYEITGRSMMSKMLPWRQQLEHKEVQAEIEKLGDGVVEQSVESFSKLDILNRIGVFAAIADAILLAIYGEKDDIIDPTSQLSLNGTWPNVRTIGLTESKHFPMLEETAKFHRLLKDFLEIEDDLSALELKEEWRRRTR